MPDRSVVRAAGGVLWRRVEDVVQVAIVHRPKYDDWSLPKGKLDLGEAPVLGGLREVREETGFDAVAGRPLGVSRYRVLDRGREADKTVQWWAMRAGGGEFVPGPEVDALRWLPVRSALARVTSGYDCAPLKLFAEHPPDTTTVLLVRHGRAGSRETWDGADDERPLDERGRAQAETLAAVLPAYAPERVLSAPPLRCLETVRPLAGKLGVAVEQTPTAGEGQGSPAGLADLLRSLGAGGFAAVVCSQGGVIPDAVGVLTGRTGLSARKGSLWALSFAGDGLADAAYSELDEY